MEHDGNRENVYQQAHYTGMEGTRFNELRSVMGSRCSSDYFQDTGYSWCFGCQCELIVRLISYSGSLQFGQQVCKGGWGPPAFSRR